MPRIPRGDSTHGVFHVISRGVDRRSVFESNRDRRLFLDWMREAFDASDTALFAYCLMGNHFHILVATNVVPLNMPMHRLLLRYSLHFNRVHDRVGHLFQARYTAKPCKDLSHLIHLVAYIHKNPVRAGLCASPEDWPWSSHAEFVQGQGRLLSPERLMEATGMDVEELREQYRDRLSGSIAAATTVSAVIREAADAVGVDAIELASGRRGPIYTRAKQLAIKLADRNGLSLVELARGLNCTASALTHLRNSKN